MQCLLEIYLFMDMAAGLPQTWRSLLSERPCITGIIPQEILRPAERPPCLPDYIPGLIVLSITVGWLTDLSWSEISSISLARNIRALHLPKTYGRTSF